MEQKYDPDEVALFLIYSKERHPGEPGYREFTHTTTDEEKFAYATMMSGLTNLPIAVDSISEDTLKLYGQEPNPAYVVDADGNLVFEQTWADVNKIEEVVNQLLAMRAG